MYVYDNFKLLNCGKIIPSMIMPIIKSGFKLFLLSCYLGTGGQGDIGTGGQGRQGDMGTWGTGQYIKHEARETQYSESAFIDSGSKLPIQVRLWVFIANMYFEGD